jgi:hypothetical protein
MQVEASFSNPNPFVNEKVLRWLSECADVMVRTWEREEVEEEQAAAAAAGSVSSRVRSHTLLEVLSLLALLVQKYKHGHIRTCSSCTAATATTRAC